MTSTAPAPMGLRERNKQDKLARIKRAARDLFAKKGFEGATAREICRRARIATGTLFLYARDKRELLFLVFRDEARSMLEEGTARAQSDLPLPEALMEVFGRFLDFYARNPALATVIAGEFFYRNGEPTEMVALTQEFLDRIGGLVERAKARGELRADVETADHVLAFFAHYAFHVQAWLGGGLPDRQQTDLALRRAIELQMQGLAPAPSCNPSSQTPKRSDRRGR